MSLKCKGVVYQVAKPGIVERLLSTIPGETDKHGLKGTMM